MSAKRSDRIKKPVYSIVVLLVLTLSISASVVVYWWLNRPLIDKSIVKDATFPVYIPKEAPEGYKLDSGQTKLDSDMLVYEFVSQDHGGRVVVTVQPMPTSFDMQKLIGSGSVSSTSTELGALYDLSVSSNSKFLLDTGDTLVFLTSDRRIETSTITAIANNLNRQN